MIGASRRVCVVMVLLVGCLTLNSAMEETIQSAASFDGPVQTVEREESVAPIAAQDDAAHVNEVQQEHEHNNHVEEEIAQNRVIPVKDLVSTTEQGPAGSAARFGLATAPLFALAVLLVLEF